MRPKICPAIAANQWNKGGLKGMYSPFAAGRIQLPEACISQTTSPSRGSPRLKNGSLPRPQNKNTRQRPEFIARLRNLDGFGDGISVTAPRDGHSFWRAAGRSAVLRKDNERFLACVSCPRSDNPA